MGLLLGDSSLSYNFDKGTALNFGILLLLCLITWITTVCVSKYTEYQADMAVGKQHGCQLPPELPKRWPLGIDRIKELWNSNAEGHLLSFLCSIAKDYEPRNNLSQYLLFGPRAFHILHPKNVESLLSTDFQNYGLGARPAVFAPLLGSGIFTQEGQKWKHSRELLRKQLAKSDYQQFDQFSEHVENLINLIPTAGTTDLQPLFFKLTMDTATALLFGQSVYSLRSSIDQDRENKTFDESFNVAQEGLAKRFRIAPFHFLYNTQEFRQSCQTVHKFVERYIDESVNRKTVDSVDPRSWFIDQITKESDSKEAIRNQLINLLLAGRDTTACCLSWTFRLLVRHASTMDRLRQEIASVMGDSSKPTREQIRRMPFLTCVIMESLRLYPPVPLNNREAVKTTVLPVGGGPDGTSPMLVRKGEVVVFSQYVNSRRKNIYGADADEFHPERWENEKLSGIGWAFFPFLGGPRRCLGEDFAMMEIYYTVVRLLQTFSIIQLPMGEKSEAVGSEKQRLTLVLSSTDGCKVQIYKTK